MQNSKKKREKFLRFSRYRGFAKEGKISILMPQTSGLCSGGREWVATHE
jgi:hypothetical protein